MRSLVWPLVVVGLGCSVSSQGETGTASSEGTAAVETFGGSVTGAPTLPTSDGPGSTGPGEATGGTSTGGSSGGGSSGETADPTGGTPLHVCGEVCQVDADCSLEGENDGFTCHESKCVLNLCTDDMTCVVMNSFWSYDCATQADCDADQFHVCIDISGGVGRCAIASSDEFMCSGFLSTEWMFPLIEGGAPITVCVTLAYTCDLADGQCKYLCHDDSLCAQNSAHPICDADTGLCVCTTDSQCQESGAPGWNACHDGVCGCASDADCAGFQHPALSVCHAGVCGCAVDADCVGPNWDTCQGGACGCSSADVCTEHFFDGTTPVCAPA